MRHDEEFVLFLDEGLHRCKPILDALIRLGIKYERHCDYFLKGAEDLVWLPVVGENGWAVLTTDKEMRYNQLEIAMIKAYKVREFVFTSGNLSGQDMAEILVSALPKMKRLFRKTDAPFVASITQTSNVHIKWQVSEQEGENAGHPEH